MPYFNTRVSWKNLVLPKKEIGNDKYITLLLKIIFLLWDIENIEQEKYVPNLRKISQLLHQIRSLLHTYME